MLKLYALGFTPNAPGQLHFIGSHSALLNRLGTPALEVDENDYRIDGGTLRVAFSNNSAYVDAITYAIITDSSGAWRCYHVNHGVLRTSFAVFDVSVDWWGTAYDDSKVRSMFLRRLNRKLTRTGVYDRPTTISARPTITPVSTVYAQSMAIIFAVTFDVAKESISGAQSATRIYRVTIGASDLPSLLAKIANIYAVAADDESIFKSYNARVFDAWIAPAAFFPTGTESAVKFKTYDGQNDVTITALHVGTGYKDLNVDTFIAEPGKAYYFGTIGHHMELLPTVGSSQLWMRGTASNESINVMIFQGERSEDVTDAFHVSLTLNDGNLTGQQRVAKVLGNVAAGVSQSAQIVGGAALIAGGNPGGVVSMTAGATGLAGTISAWHNPQLNTTRTPSGDALSNMLKNADGQITLPWVIIEYSGTDLSAYRARQFGASYALTQWSGLTDFSLNELMGTAIAAADWPNATYIEADVIYRGQNTPATVFTNEIASGVLYEVL